MLNGRAGAAGRLVAAALALSLGSAAYASRLAPGEAISHVGENADVCETVASANYEPKVKGAPTFLDLGAPYPKQSFTAVVWGAARARFSVAPETLRGATICVSGVVAIYRGKTQIEVSDPHQIRTVSSED